MPEFILPPADMGHTADGGPTMTDVPLDRDFWNTIFKRVVRRTRGYAGEDSVQTAFLRLQRYQEANVVKNPAAFLVQTAINAWRDQYRHDSFLEANQTGGEVYLVESETPLQDEVIIARERLKRVCAGLEHLPDRTREVFLLHRVEGMKCKDIARHFGISLSAVEKHIANAVRFLTEWSQGW
jgi:RNA polymerase sigma-70 factor (ECF subfamily)